MKISFCTPLFFKETPASSVSSVEGVWNVIEQYFTLNNTIFEVEPPEDSSRPFVRKGRFTKDASSFTATVLKIVSYITVIIPLLMLLAKFILRFCFLTTYDFTDIKKAPSIVPTTISPDVETEKIDEVSLTAVTESEEEIGDDIRLLVSPTDQLLPKETRWLFSEMPTLPKEIKIPVKLANLDEAEVCESLLKLCQSLDKRKRPANCTEGVVVGAFISFNLKEFPGIKFRVIGNDFFGPIAPMFKDRLVIDAESSMNRYCYYMKVVQTQIRAMMLSHLHLPEFKMFQLKGFTGQILYFIAEEDIALSSPNNSKLIWRAKDIELRDAFIEVAQLVEKTKINSIYPAACVPCLKKNVWCLVITAAHARSSSDDEFARKGMPPEGIQQLIKNVYSQESMEAVATHVSRRYQKSLKMLIEQRQKRLNTLFMHEKVHFDRGTEPYTAPSPLPDDEEFLETLGLNLKERGFIKDNKVIGVTKPVFMNYAVRIFVSYLNQLLETNRLSAGFSSLVSHCVVYDPLIFEHDPLCKWDIRAVSSKGPDGEEGLWVHRILDALQNQKLICSWKIIPNRWNRDAQKPSWQDKIEIWF